MKTRREERYVMKRNFFFSSGLLIWISNFRITDWDSYLESAVTMKTNKISLILVIEQRTRSKRPWFTRTGIRGKRRCAMGTCEKFRRKFSLYTSLHQKNRVFHRPAILSHHMVEIFTVKSPRIFVWWNQSSSDSYT